MTTTRKAVLALVGAVAMGVAGAAPSVEITSVQQQYPWTNTVDIVYTVAGVDSETNGYFVVFTPTTSTGEPILDVNGEKSVQVALKGSGVYSTQWFPQTNQQYTACKMTPSVFRGAAKDYMIVDLLTGAVTYEPMATQEASNQRYNTQEYKTTKMVFRRIPKGEYTIMDGLAKANMEKDYYAGVFEVTIGQYSRLTGSGDANSTVAIGGLTWATVRGSALPAARVASGPIASLNTKVRNAGNPDLYFDLPTEAMWEVAARANCPTNYFRYWGTTTYNGSSDIDTYAIYKELQISAFKTFTVGQKVPNAWGLYDVIGNAWEWCRDAGELGYCEVGKDYIDDMSMTQEPHSKGNYRTYRGGGYGDVYGWLRLSARPHNATASTTWANRGFRIFLICND